MSRPPENITKWRTFITWVAMIALLGLGWFVYQPGLDGGFLFDDWVNLNALGAYGPVDNVATLWLYLTSGTADATGRPLALLSFLLDAQDWPADPYSFKRTNLILHLINGALLTLLLARLGRASIQSDHDVGAPTTLYRRVDLAAVLGGGLWLLHPLFVSTTLYIVQREAMLPATFILLGLYGYTVGWQWVQAGKRSGIVLAAASILICTVLATLCKANGALLPILAWVLDAVLLVPRQCMKHPRIAATFRWTRRAVIVLPSIVVLAALASVALRGFVDGIQEVRPWTLTERLLTQPRVVVDYLQLLWLPQPYSNGLFNDAVVVSRSLLSPPSTLLAIVFLSCLVAVAVFLRERTPIITASILFFFAAHLMESSVVPLELYFEHRNYIPAMLMFWPLGWWLAGAWAGDNRNGLVFFKKCLFILLPLLLGAFTYLRADVWGNTADQALLWAERNPDSARAQAYAAQTLVHQGNSILAIKRLEEALAKTPDELQLFANLINARCATGATVTAEDIKGMSRALAKDRTRNLSFGWLSNKLDGLTDGTSVCRGLSISTLEQWVNSSANNPWIATSPGRAMDAHHLRGRINLLQNQPLAALESFNTALEISPTPAKALNQAATLAQAGYPELGIQHLDNCSPSCGELPGWGRGMPALHARLLESQNYWQSEIEHLKSALVLEAAQGDE